MPQVLACSGNNPVAGGRYEGFRVGRSFTSENLRLELPVTSYQDYGEEKNIQKIIED